jgi:hypothetical protein
MEQIQKENEESINSQISLTYTGRDVNSIPGFSADKIPRSQLLDGSTVNIDLFEKQTDEIQQKLDKLQDGLCNGFSF